MSTFYLAAKSLEQAQQIAEEYGPDVWYDRRENAADITASVEASDRALVFPDADEFNVYKVTVTVEEDS